MAKATEKERIVSRTSRKRPHAVLRVWRAPGAPDVERLVKAATIFLAMETDTEISSPSILGDVVIVTRQSNFDERFRSEARNVNSRTTFPTKSIVYFDYDRLRVHSTLGSSVKT